MRRIQILLQSMCVTLAAISTAFCQVADQDHLVYTPSFTKTLEHAGIEFYEPVERWLHVVPERKDGLMACDLILQNDRNDFEVRYRIRNMGKKRRVPQNVEVNRLLASIASNDGQDLIRVQIPDGHTVRQQFNADAGMFARFTPKATFSEKPFGTLISLYVPDRAAVDIVLLYYDAEYAAAESFGNIRFK